MRFYAVSGSAAQQRTDCAIVGIYESGALSAGATQIDAVLGAGSPASSSAATRAARPRGAVARRRGRPLRARAAGRSRQKDAFNRKQYKKALVAAANAVARTGARTR